MVLNLMGLICISVLVLQTSHHYKADTKGKFSDRL